MLSSNHLYLLTHLTGPQETDLVSSSCPQNVPGALTGQQQILEVMAGQKRYRKTEVFLDFCT